jgi:hypothetical protein
MKTGIYIFRKALLFALVFTLSAALSAQDAGKKDRETPEEMAASQTEIIADSLELTPEQTEKVREINLDFVQKVKAAKERKASEAEMKLLYKNRTDSVKQLLNREQLTRWEDIAIRKHQRQEVRKERIKAARLQAEKDRGRDRDRKEHGKK